MREPSEGARGLQKRRPLAGPSGRSEDRRGCEQYNQSPSEYVPRSAPWPRSSPTWTVSTCTTGSTTCTGDGNIAVALVADAAASASDIALIVSADSDLCPAIRTARTLNPKRRMIAAFPPRRSSFEIRSLIRKPFTLAAADIRNSLLPEVVTDPASGRVHKRPGKWR